MGQACPGLLSKKFVDYIGNALLILLLASGVYQELRGRRAKKDEEETPFVFLTEYLVLIKFVGMSVYL